MKLTLILSAAILASMVVTAQADTVPCLLRVNSVEEVSTVVPRGQSYQYILELYDFGPGAPTNPPRWTVLFFGTKNEVADIPPTGEPYPGVYPLGTFALTGFQNPLAGGLTGVYTRYVVILDLSGNVVCTSNNVEVTLQ